MHHTGQTFYGGSGGGGSIVPIVIEMMLLRHVRFCNHYNDWRMLSCGGIRGFGSAKPVHNPHRYGIRFGNGMGYILEEHFVTLWRCRR